jgi:diacylglycerol kinase (ATP)
MPVNRPLLIVNPRSGSARTGREFPGMLTAIERALGDVDIAYTARGGHAVELARRGVAEGHDLIVAVGGDGTFSEVANGVLQAQQARRGAGGRRPRVGLIATGTGGDFRRSLGIEHKLDAYLDALTSGRERQIDVGKTTFADETGGAVDHFFVNVLSAGMGGLVDRYVAKSPAFIGGRAAYYTASLRALIACRRRPLRLRIWSDEPSTAGPQAAAIPLPIELCTNAWVVAICNGSWFGAGMHVCPPALPGDGRLDVVVVSLLTKREFLRKLPMVYRGEHLSVEGVDYFTCTRIEVELDDDGAPGSPFLLDVDGEPLGRLPLAVQILPGELVVRA